MSDEWVSVRAILSVRINEAGQIELTAKGEAKDGDKATIVMGITPQKGYDLGLHIARISIAAAEKSGVKLNDPAKGSE